MIVACLDLEGVLVPEVWINVAERTGIDELKLTTRDVADYDELMAHRLSVLSKHDLRLRDITAVIAQLAPLPGAGEFLDWLRARFQVVILSDTFYQFADPLMIALGRPTLFCHDLEVDEDDRIVGYRLRMADQKRHSVAALQQINFAAIATGDSYNDISMLGQAEEGIWFNPPESVVEQFPQYPVARDYDQMRREFTAAAERIAVH